ncbi:glycosyl transferase family 2 [candidate division TA06 bacterium B3_TA06]|uniref:Glycosyl transferase family 2 n=1 Tax=candidate division TA06 bacterium B3_TA06 TaxID=2012487 RepID=A0A532VBD7_UNCT6|nr:MAG: glycosyl transferase family 2 [candidate division TA06 bacterium B3_TA06]
MNAFWTPQAAIIVFLLVVLAVVISNLIILNRMRLGRYPLPKHLPRVSVMVPARNEEKNISSCVESLLSQDYHDFELLVLDDHSTDRTWEILQELARENKKLRIIKGKPLPSDWLGKHWACQQMAEEASGELFLFTDADTQHHHLALRDAVAALISEDADLLTALPAEEVGSWGAKLIVPLLPSGLLALLPLSIAYRVHWPALCAAIGGFMLFRREAYQKVGGFEAVRTNPVDDIAIGRIIKAQGFRWRLADGQDRISCWMYSNFREAFEGFAKSLYAAFNRSVPIFLLIWLWLAIVFWEPLVVLALRIGGVPISDLSLILAGAAIGISLLLWGISLWRFRFPIHLAFLYPVSMLIGFVIAMYSMIVTLTGRAVWKGRRVGM